MNPDDGLPRFSPPRLIVASGERRLTDHETLRLSIFAREEAARMKAACNVSDAGGTAALQRVLLTIMHGGEPGQLRRELDKLDGRPRKKRWIDE